MKLAQAASEIKPTLQQVYINKVNPKLKSMGKATATSSKKRLSKSWWTYPYSVGWKKFTQPLKLPQDIQQEKFLQEQIASPTLSPTNNQNKNVKLSLDMEIVKITTVVEAIRQKRRNSSQTLEAAKNIQKIIGKKRSKRSSSESRNNSTVIKNSRHAPWERTFVSNRNRKSRHPKPNSKEQATILPRGERLQNKDTADLKAATNIAIPSTIFYKRIWEYINGTRPHSDITSGYGSLEDDSEKNNSTCTDKDPVTAVQPQEEKLQAISPTIKPQRNFYEHIWDIINSIQSNGNAKARSKRNAKVSKRNAALTPLCALQEETADYKRDQQKRATNEGTLLDITDTINLQQEPLPDSAPYISGFWTVANQTQWQSMKMPVVNPANLNNDSTSLVNDASEVDDLNKFPDKVQRVTYASLDNSTDDNEARNSSQEIISEPGPPYSSEESLAISSFSPTESVVDKESQEEEPAENYSTDTTPAYDPSNIPYIEVPDYSDRQEESLDKSNQNATAAGYKEYDDGDYDYGPKQLHDADDDDVSSKPLNTEMIKVAQTESNEPETSLNSNNSRSNVNCTENKDSTECVDNYDVEDSKLRNNTENATNDHVHHAEENSAESKESENSDDFVDFDINEYKKPINWNEFFKNDPILEKIQAIYSKKNRTEESEEIDTYATDPKEKSYDYFEKNEDSHDDRETASNDRSKTEEETDFYAEKQAKESNKDDYPYYDKDYFKRIHGKDNDDKESEYNHRENSNRTEESEEVETYATDPEEQSQDHFMKNEDEENHRTASDETDDKEEENDYYTKKETKGSEVTDEYYYPYDDKDFFKNIFGRKNNKRSSDMIDKEKEFLTHHFTEDVLRQMQDNSTSEEDRQREESRHREKIHKTLSKILNKKNRFSRLDDNLNKMIEKGEAVPIQYNNYWSLAYESPRKRNKNNKENIDDSEEEA